MLDRFLKFFQIWKTTGNLVFYFFSFVEKFFVPFFVEIKPIISFGLSVMWKGQVYKRTRDIPTVNPAFLFIFSRPTPHSKLCLRSLINFCKSLRFSLRSDLTSWLHWLTCAHKFNSWPEHLAINVLVAWFLVLMVSDTPKVITDANKIKWNHIAKYQLN